MFLMQLFYSPSHESVADGIVSGANVRRSLDNKEFKEKPMEFLQDRCDVTFGSGIGPRGGRSQDILYCVQLELGVICDAVELYVMWLENITEGKKG